MAIDTDIVKVGEEIRDRGPNWAPCPIAEAKRAALIETQRESQRGRLLQRQEPTECLATKSAEDVLPSADMDMDFEE